MKFGVGQPVRRKEDARLVTGQGQYLDDLTFEGLAHACFVRSPHAHAVIRSVETGEAESMAGVAGVLTAQDTAGTGYVMVRAPMKNRDGSALPQSPKLMLPQDKVRFTGE